MKIKNKKNIFSFLLVLVSGVGVFFLVAPAHAADAGWAATIVANLISVIISGLGMILSLVISALIAVAQYSNFINAPAVTNGWKIVRDVCNMFFVLVLLIIAFATILKIEKYNYKQWLPKLILMAILINFSKTICGLLIDLTQVIMLTFVNAFKDVGGGNIVDTLGLKDIMTLATNDNTTGTVTFLQVTGGYLIGLIYLLIALVVIITMLAMLVIRMVMIWIYVVLSPAAYLFSAFPDGKAYASQWWSEFTKNLIVGPVLAFFIWLSFASLQATNITVANGSVIAGADSGVANTTVSPGDKAFSATNASTPNFFIKFVVAIGMLIGGLTVTQQIGGTAGGMAGKGMSKISKGAAFAGGLGVGALAFTRKKAVAGVKSVGNAGVALTLGSDRSKKLLGNMAASSNPLLKYSGLRSLATGGLIKSNNIQKEIEDKAEKKINSLKNAKVVARYAREGATLPSSKAAQKKARNMMPSTLGDPTKIAEKLAGMSREDLNKLSDPEWHAIGQSGAEVKGRALSYIQKNSDERGAYNLGKQKAGQNNFVAGTDKFGAPLNGPEVHGSYMNANTPGGANNPNTPIDTDEQSRLERAGKYETFYYKEPSKLAENKTTRVEDDKANAPRGNGNLAVNEFGREKSNTVAVDFDKLNVKGIDKGTDRDNRNIRGVNTSDASLIKEVSSKMVGMIDQELNQIKSKGAKMTIGDNNRVNNLEAAKVKFSKPEAIDNLSMVNSSAASYKLSDVKASKVHEEVHGLGVQDEDDTRYVTQEVLSGKKYDAKTGRTDEGTVSQILADKPKNNVSHSNESIDDVLTKERESGQESGGEVTINTDNLDKSMENFSKKLDEVSTKFAGKNSGSVNAGILTGGANKPQPNFTYLFNNLRKAVEKQSVNVGKKISALGGDEATTPLEVDVIASQVADLEKNQK